MLLELIGGKKVVHLGMNVTAQSGLIPIGGGSSEPPVWQITEDVIRQSVTVKTYEGDTTQLPDGTQLSIVA